MANKIDLSGGKQQLTPQGILDTKNALKAHSREYANSTDRVAGADVTSEDVGTLALQLDTNALWLLTGVGPVTWEAVGGVPLEVPEFCLTSPRAISADDHGTYLLAAAYVLGGFTFSLPNTVPSGTRLRIGCIGLDLKIRCSGAGVILMGAGILETGVPGIAFQQAGYHVDLLYIGEIGPGVYAWGVLGGTGVAIVLDGSGVLTSNQFFFNSIIGDATPGNILTVDARQQTVDSGTAIEALRTRVATITPINSTPYSIQDTDLDDILSWQGVGTGTLVLPDSATVGLGWRVRVQNKGTAPAPASIVAAAGADVIHFAGSLVSTALLTTELGASLEFISDGAGAWLTSLGEGTWTDGTITHHYNANIFGGTSGNLVSIDAYGDVQDSGVAASGLGGTLDTAYDFGGAGVGRAITADTGAVEITVPDTANNAGVVITQNDVTNTPPALFINNAGAYGADSIVLAGNSRSIISRELAASIEPSFLDIGALHGGSPISVITMGSSNAGTGDAETWIGAYSLDSASTATLILEAFGGGTTLVQINSNEDIEFAANGGAAIPFNDAVHNALVGFTATSVIGALNELKATPAGDGGGDSMTTYSNVAGDFSVVYKDADEVEVFGLPFSITAVQFKRIIRKPTGAAASVIKTRGSDLVCTWTPSGSVPGSGTILTTSFGTLAATDEYIVEIEGPPKGYNAATDSAKSMVTNALHYVHDGDIASLSNDSVEVLKPLLIDGYNAMSITFTGNSFGEAGDNVTVQGTNDPSGTKHFYDITALAFGVPRVTVSGAYQSAEPLMFQWIKLIIDGTGSDASVELTRFRK